MENSVSLVSINTRGLGDKTKRIDILKRIKEQRTQIACLQDIHIDMKMQNIVRAEWGLDIFFSSYTSNARGVAILLNNNFEYTVHNSKSDSNGNFIAIDLTIENYTRLTLLNLYGPNTDSPEFYTNIKSVITDFENDNIIICGDWNLVLNPEKDTFNYKTINNPKARAEVLALIEEKELVDVWRSFHENENHFTWFKKNPIKMARLDFFLVSENILSLVTKTDILSKYRSDHAPIKITLTFSNHTHGKSNWKFNNSLLSDVEFVNMVKKCINEIKIQYAASPYDPHYILHCPNAHLQLTISDQLFLETLLCQLRGKIISYSANKKRQSTKVEAQLEKDIQTIENLIKGNPTNFNEYSQKLEDFNLELETIRNKKAQGAIIRSRAVWHEQGEKSTKYFCNLENRNYVNKSIQKLETENGTILTDITDILKEQKLFYENLYTNKDNEDNLDELLNSLINTDSLNKISESEKQTKEGPITYTELLASLKRAKNNKSPGMDGYTIEFYKFFWRDIGHFLLRSINEGYAKGSLSSSQKQGIITCIPKPGKPRNNLKNWRPITLLNTVYKLASSCIAERIKSSLDSIIHETQKGFIPGRFVGENTRLIFDIMHETEKQNIPGLLMMVDFEKAFDSVSWAFIQKTLKLFNFGESLIKWVNTFYNDTSATIIQNGYFSEFFKLGRGCRQGDPLSPYLFILCAEILGTAIRNNPDVKGITIGGIEHKLTQFADDTTLFLDGTKDSLQAAINIFKCFYHISGLKINNDKTKLVWIGSMKDSDRRFCREANYEWVHKANFTILGITYNTDMSTIVEINLRPKMFKMQNILKLWKMRYLSPIGKITVIKSLVLPIITHILSSLPDPHPSIVKEIEDMFFLFVWNKNRGKVKKQTLKKEIKEGGLNMIDVNTYIKSLKLSWMKRYIFGSGSWKCFLEFSVGTDFLSTGSGNLKRLKIDNPFWKCVVDAWVLLDKTLQPQSIDDIFNQPIWHNSNIKFDYVESWQRKGIHYLYNLFSLSGNLLTFKELKDKYKIKCTYLDYIRLIKHIPNAWLLKTIGHIPNFGPSLQPILKIMCTKTKGCKVYYKALQLEESKKILKSQEKWLHDLNIDFECSTWSHAYYLPYMSTLDADLRYFQFRILHRILTTNHLKKIIGVNEDDRCTFCKLESETLLHIFTECVHVKPIWSDMCGWLKRCGYTDLQELDSCDIILGIMDKDIIVNLCILITKLVIYRSRLGNKRPSFAAVKAYIRYFKHIEQVIAYTNNNEEKFLGKWSALYHSL
jgi:exonuclease III